MALSHIYLGDERLNSKQTEALSKNLDKKTLNFEYVMSDTDLNGEFIDQTAWNAFLWDKVSTEIGFTGTRKSKKTTSSITGPGEYPVEVEVNGYSYKGKIKFKQKSGDTSSPQIKRNSHPKSVKVGVNGAKKSDLPKEYLGDLDSLIAEMKKPASYSYVGGTGSNKGWSINFGKHLLHEQPGHGWKAYIDVSNSTGTTWRLYFDIEFDTGTQAMNVSLTRISEDH